MTKLSNQPAPQRAAIVAALREFGPMHTTDIAEHPGVSSKLISATIRDARRRYPGKVFRITGYLRSVGKWNMDQPIYAAQVGADAEKPKVDPAKRKRESNARWRERHAAIEAAKKRAKRAKGAPVVNIWSGLAPRSMLNVMTAVAANTTMQEAA